MSRFRLLYSFACFAALLTGYSAVMALAPVSVSERDTFWARTVATHIYHHRLTNPGELGEGWASPDPSGTRSNRRKVMLLIDLERQFRGDVEFEFAFTPLLVLGVKSQTVLVSVNDRPVGKWTLKGQMQCKVASLQVNQDIWNRNHPKTIAFEFKNPISPAEVGFGPGTDPLGIQLSSMVIRTVP